MTDLNKTPVGYIPNRGEVRKMLGNLVRGAASSYQRVDTYQSDDLAGESPILRIMSSGSYRPGQTFQGTSAKFHYTLQSLVLYKDEQDYNGVPSTWTPENAEDTLDDLEMQLAAALFNQKFDRNQPIMSIEQASDSRIRKDVIQGKTYLVEYIPITVEVRYGKTI